MSSTIFWSLIVVTVASAGGRDEQDDRIAQLQRKNETLTAALARSEAVAVGLRHRVAELEATLSVQTRSLRKSNQQLLSELEEARAHVARFEAELSQRRQEWLDRYQDLEAGRHQAERLAEQRSRETEETLKRRDRRIAELEVQLSEARSVRKSVAELEEELGAGRQEKAGLLESRGEIEQDLSGSRAREKVLEERCARLEGDLRDALRRQGERDWEGLSTMLRAREAELASLRAERDELKVRLERGMAGGGTRAAGPAPLAPGKTLEKAPAPTTRKARRKI